MIALDFYSLLAKGLTTEDTEVAEKSGSISFFFRS